MGWTYPYDTPTRKDVIRDRIEGETGTWKGRPVKRICERHCYRGSVHRGVLWTVWRIKDAETDEVIDSFIGCDLLHYSRSKDYGSGWGYKDMCESSGPYYYSCPLSYLDMVPMPDSPYAPEWREKVRAYHAQRNKKLVVGQTYPATTGVKIGSRHVVEVTIKKLRPLLGAVKLEDGEVIPEVKLKKRHVEAEPVPA
jgi:hypothetical protein